MVHVLEIDVFDKDQIARQVATLDALIALIGEVQASPTANTTLDRLKTLATLLTAVDGHVDGIEALLTTHSGFLDGIEGLITSTNSALSTIDGRVDGLETLITATNTKLDTVITAVQAIDTGTPAALATGGGMKVAAVNAAGTQVDPVAAGSAAMAASVPVTMATDDTIKAPLAGVAHDAADSGNPIKVGFKAVGAQSDLTLVTDDDRSNMTGGRDGSLYVRSVALEDIVSGNASNTDGTLTSVIGTAGAGIKQYLTRISLSNAHASTVAIVDIKSGATIKYTVAVPPGGREISFDPPLPPNAADEAWGFDPQAAVTTLYCAMVGFKSKV